MLIVTSKLIISCLTKSVHIHQVRSLSFRDWYAKLWTPREINPPYKHIVQIGDPVLRRKAELVPKDQIKSKEISEVVEQMIHVLRKYDCVGLAAPQIGVPLQIIIMEFHEGLMDEFPEVVYKARGMETLPLTVIINPSLTILNYEKKTFLEACASVKGYSGEVDRFKEIELIGVTEQDEPINLKLKDWNARIAQHELDHLNGTIYTDKMNRKTFMCTSWQQVNRNSGRLEIPFYPK